MKNGVHFFEKGFQECESGRTYFQRKGKNSSFYLYLGEMEAVKEKTTVNSQQTTVMRLSLAEHEGKARMFADFSYNRAIIKAIKEIPGAQWSSSKKQWHFAPTNQVYLLLKEKVKGLATLDASELKEKVKEKKAERSALKPMPTEEQRKALDWYRKWMLSCGYAQNTIETYCTLLETFFLFVKDKPVRGVTENDVINFNSDFIVKTKRSDSYQRQCINAIKLFYEQVKDRRMRLDKLERVRRAKTLPQVLSLQEVSALLSSYSNVKHKTMMVLTYACGLRRSEVLNLKWKDIDRHRMVIYVRLGKGKKDRQVVMPPVLLELLEKYWKAEKTKEYVFEGQYGEQYSTESMRQVLKQGLLKAGIKKNISLHGLRHSFATHVLEQGTDVHMIQKLLGHKSIKTTMIYLHVSQRSLHDVKNPINDLDLM